MQPCFAFFVDFAVFSSWAEEIVFAKEECFLKMQTCASCRVGTYHSEDLIAGTMHKTLDEEDLNEGDHRN